MITHKKFIEDLLKESEGINEGFFIPTEIELEIKKIKNFDIATATELSLMSENILNEQRGINNEILSESNFSVPLITFDNERGLIRFYPIALKTYLNKII